MHGQATATASQRLHLQGFAAVSYVRPDYGAARKNAGGMVGIDADLIHFGPVETDLDIRVTGSGGRVSNQYTYGGGPRFILSHGPVRPYADVLLSYGTIVLANPVVPSYTKDHTFVLSYGGGADILLNEAWAVKADIQSQRWVLDDRAPAIHPLAISVGLRYQLRFHNRHDAGY